MLRQGAGLLRTGLTLLHWGLPLRAQGEVAPLRVQSSQSTLGSTSPAQECTGSHLGMRSS